MDKNITPAKIKSNIYMNLSNRMYLSVVRQDVSDKLVYVYTLGCPGAKNDSFFLKVDTDVATFNKPKSADLYMGTVQQIMRIQSTWPLYSIAQGVFKAEIDAFNDAIKSICDNQKVK